MFTIGHKPYWILQADGKTVWRNGLPSEQQPAEEWREYEAIISRIDIEAGLNQVQVCTFIISGAGAPMVGLEMFPRGTEITVLFGYEAQDEDSQDPEVLFKGTVLQGQPSGKHPIVVEIQADSQLFRAREAWFEDTEVTREQSSYLTAVYEELGLTFRAPDYEDNTADEGGSMEGNVLEETFRWAEENAFHLVDTMNGEIHLVRTHSARPKFLDQDPRTWELAFYADKDEESIAPVLTEWAPDINFVDAPEVITGAWYAERDESDETAEVAVLEAVNENGLEGTTVHLGRIRTATKEEAQQLLDAWAAHYYWISVEGNFELNAGLPIRIFDDIVPRNGPPGLEDFFDKAFTVIGVHHTFDHRGWLTRGTIRGTMV